MKTKRVPRKKGGGSDELQTQILLEVPSNREQARPKQNIKQANNANTNSNSKKTNAQVNAPNTPGISQVRHNLYSSNSQSQSPILKKPPSGLNTKSPNKISNNARTFFPATAPNLPSNTEYMTLKGTKLAYSPNTKPKPKPNSKPYVRNFGISIENANKESIPLTNQNDSRLANAYKMYVNMFVVVYNYIKKNPDIKIANDSVLRWINMYNIEFVKKLVGENRAFPFNVTRGNIPEPGNSLSQKHPLFEYKYLDFDNRDKQYEDGVPFLVQLLQIENQINTYIDSNSQDDPIFNNAPFMKLLILFAVLLNPNEVSQIVLDKLPPSQKKYNEELYELRTQLLDPDTRDKTLYEYANAYHRHYAPVPRIGGRVVAKPKKCGTGAKHRCSKAKKAS